MKENIVVKKNEMLRFGYNLSVNEQRLLLACISQIDSRSTLDSNQQFVVTVQEIKDLFSLDGGQVYAQLKTACDRLFERKIVTREGTSTTKLRWVYKVIYDETDSTIKLNFSPDVIPYLTSISKNFTRYKLKEVANFKCVYSVRIYELFAQFQGVGAVNYDIDELRWMLDVENKYTLYGDFRRNVIERAISEINLHSNLEVTFAETKVRRKVVSLQFAFKTKSKPIAPAKTKTKAVSNLTAPAKPTEKEEFDALVNEFANSRKRFGTAINETNVPENVIEILKSQGRW